MSRIVRPGPRSIEVSLIGSTSVMQEGARQWGTLSENGSWRRGSGPGEDLGVVADGGEELWPDDQIRVQPLRDLHQGSEDSREPIVSHALLKRGCPSRISCLERLGVGDDETLNRDPGVLPAEPQSSPVQTIDLNRPISLRSFGKELAVAGEGQMLERLFRCGVEEQWQTALVQRKLVSFVAAVASAADEQVVEPVEGAFRIDVLGPEVVDRGALAVLTVGAPLNAARHRSQGLPNLTEGIIRLEKPKLDCLGAWVRSGCDLLSAVSQKLESHRAEWEPLEAFHLLAAKTRNV